MYIPYNTLPNNSRIWIYQSNREFTKKEVEYISKKAQDFINQWTRHGDRLKGSFMIRYNHFLALAVDESFTTISGCSIDSSVRFVKELENELNLDLMNKMNVTFKDENRIYSVKLINFQQLVKQGRVTPETIVFNNMVSSKSDFESNWEIPAKDSWHKRFLV